MSGRRTKRKGAKTQGLFDIGACRLFLDEDEDGFLPLVRTGVIRGFDIRKPGCPSGQIRVVPDSLFEFLSMRQKRARLGNSEWARLRRLLFGDKKELTAAELARVLTCSHSHVLNLIRIGEIATAPDARIARGPEGSPRILVSAAAHWLRGRLMTGDKGDPANLRYMAPTAACPTTPAPAPQSPPISSAKGQLNGFADGVISQSQAGPGSFAGKPKNGGANG